MGRAAAQRHAHGAVRDSQLTAGETSEAEGSFDWWRTADNEQDQKIHQCMLDLASQPDFMDGLLLNSNRGTSYPGGPLQCLQVV